MLSSAHGGSEEPGQEAQAGKGFCRGHGLVRLASEGGPLRRAPGRQPAVAAANLWAQR